MAPKENKLREWVSNNAITICFLLVMFSATWIFILVDNITEL